MSKRLALTIAPLCVAAGMACACAMLNPSPPRGEPLSPDAQAAGDDELSVRRVAEPIVVAAWAEPRELPPGGGSAQILVRVQRRGGARFAGVEVRIHASSGTLFSGGKTLLTDAQGMTRDRLTTQKGCTITMNAGGTRYRFRVPVTGPVR